MALSLDSLIASCRTSSLSDFSAYRVLCRAAAEDNGLFARFKQEKVYRAILEHVTTEQGAAYLYEIDKLGGLDYIAEATRNDTVGGPQTVEYAGLGSISPSTLRYLKVALELQQLFPDFGRQMRVVEIGGGYGGQARILKQLYPDLQYTIIDLPEPLMLTDRFLRALDVYDVKLMTPVEALAGPPIHGDLFVSNYALTECADTFFERYVRTVATWSPRGYVTGNAWERDLFRLLAPLGPQRREEHPCGAEGNFLCVWGVGAPLPKLSEPWHPFTVPLHIVDRLMVCQHDTTIFVETGTAAGHTVEAVREHFEDVFTIELSPMLAQAARTRFAKASNVHVVQADSREGLPQVISQLGDRRAIFWLDAHWSGGDTATRSDEIHTAVRDELAAIRATGRKDHVIMIDDLQDFKGEHGYPTVEELTVLVREINSAYKIDVYMTLRRGVLVAQPLR